MDKTPSRLFRFTRGKRGALCLAALCTALLVLAGCGSAPASRPGGDGSAMAPSRPSHSRPGGASSSGGQSTAPSTPSSESSSAQAPSSSTSTTPIGSGDAVRTGDEVLLEGTWNHRFDEDGEKLVYGYRFDPDNYFLMVYFGVQDSGSGFFYAGNYKMTGNGEIYAEVQLSDFDVPEDTPTIYLTIDAAWANSGKTALQLTLHVNEDSGGDFSKYFADILDVAMEYDYE